MAEQYQGRADDRRYAGDDVDISYNLKRCIHAKECVNRLSTVFDVDKRPWIDADGASPEKIATVIEMCPSGALHYERKDGGSDEAIPDTNRIILWHDGPLQLVGDLSVQGAKVNIEQETRVTLCRCGASKNKPFCDNTHKKTDFKADPFNPQKAPNLDADVSGKVIITATENGPLQVEGNFKIETQEGVVKYTGTKTWLCRCGESSSKPFCDGTHNDIEFQAE